MPCVLDVLHRFISAAKEMGIQSSYNGWFICFEPGMWIWPKGFQYFLCKLWKIYIGFHPSHHVNNTHMTNSSPCWPPEPSTEAPPSSPKTIRGWNSLPMSGPLNERRRRRVQICLTDPKNFCSKNTCKIFQAKCTRGHPPWQKFSVNFSQFAEKTLEPFRSDSHARLKTQIRMHSVSMGWPKRFAHLIQFNC